MLVATGVSLNVHYCMGEIASVDLHAKEKERCDRCGMEEKKGGCCSSQKQFVKYESGYKAQISALSHIGVAILPETPRFILTDPIYFHKVKESIFPQHSPPIGGPPIYIRNCTFLI
jgi:hypothetical protein